MKRLDLIINALDRVDTFDWNQQDNKLIKDARIAARSLRDMEPVGVCVEPTRYSQNDVDWYSYTPDAGTKLYALGGEE